MSGTPDTEAEASLGRQVNRGLRWSFVNTIGAKAASFASGIVLARILFPEDFGTFAAAIAVVNILFGWNDLGMLLAVVRWDKDGLKRAAGTAMTLSTSASVGIYLLCFAMAPRFADWVNSPESAGILRLVALTVVLDGLTAVPQGLLIRDFRQGRLMVIEFAAAPVNIGVTIALALAGAGPWSLAVGLLAGNAMSALLLTLLAPFRPLPTFDWPAARLMLSFGVPLAFTSLLEYILLNADYVIVAQSLGPVALGFYMLAYNMSNWPVTALTDAVRRVSIAGFARLSHDEDSLRANFSRTFVLLVTLALPICLVLGFLATPLIRFVYGAKWGPSADVLRFLAVLGGVRVTVGFIFDLLIGAGRSRTTLWLKTAWLVVLIPALSIAARVGGIRAVGIAHAVVGVAVALPLFVHASGRFGVDLGHIARRLARPMVAAVMAAGVALILLPRLGGTLRPLLTVGPAMVAVYAAIVIPAGWRSPSRWLEHLPGRKQPPVAAVANSASDG